ncbi:trkB protein [Culex quinquefasciatus]|uniref:TrkB protein n=1 Tax=Culex quinquefasciatus TaxID=7176 RepID=B0X6I4_CULQU|nr:trkB protein [Culex quinquefasciatus]|eukprot:XP_001865256.1 trkB protein [Culex quinquefasciatus]
MTDERNLDFCVIFEGSSESGRDRLVHLLEHQEGVHTLTKIHTTTATNRTGVCLDVHDNHARSFERPGSSTTGTEASTRDAVSRGSGRERDFGEYYGAPRRNAGSPATRGGDGRQREVPGRGRGRSVFEIRPPTRRGTHQIPMSTSDAESS